MDLLRTPCIRTRTSRGPSPLTLPGVFAALDAGHVAGFPELRPHQEAPWHVFLVHIAALAQRATDTRTPVDAATWLTRLLTLSRQHGAGDAGWSLCGSSPSTPAILQPADPGALAWKTDHTPDDQGLDILVNAKYHDRKFDAARRARPEHWLYALVTMQACAAYGGPRLYHTARINGAYATRTFLGTAPTHPGSGTVDVSAWWRRDVDLLLARRPRTAADPVASAERPALLWLVPWPERVQLALDGLDPWFLDTPRRLRIGGHPDGTLCVHRAGSAKPRIDAAHARGVCGDPWTAVHRTGHKALTLGGALDDRRLLDLLFGPDWVPPPAVRWDGVPPARRIAIVAHGFATRDKKLLGFYHRTVAVPPAAATALGAAPALAAAAAPIRTEVSRLYGALRGAVAHGAGLTLARGQPAPPAVTHATRLLDRRLEKLLLPHLWALLSQGDREPARQARRRDLAAAARQVLDQALATVQATAAARPIVEGRARARFQRSLYVALHPFPNHASTAAADEPEADAPPVED